MSEIIDGLTNSGYQKMEGLSASGLLKLALSPAHYIHSKLNPMEQTKEMRTGTAVHSGILENGLGTAVIIAPGSTRTTEKYKAFAEANKGDDRVLLLQDEYEEVEKMVNKLKAHPTVSRLLSGGKAEQSVFWTDPETGIKCKCRPDYLIDDGTIIDIKTTGDAATFSEFQRAIVKRKYHWQSAWYLDGLSHVMGKQLENFIHIVIETKAPHGVGIFVLDNGSLDKAREDISYLKRVYLDCLHSGEWPGYKAEIQNISIPHWEFQREVAS